MMKITLEDLKRTTAIQAHPMDRVRLSLPPVQPQPAEPDEQTKFNIMASKRIDALTHDVQLLIQYVEELRRGSELNLVLPQ